LRRLLAQATGFSAPFFKEAPSIENQVQEQRAYYARTADRYEAMHVTDDDAHGMALATFVGFAALKGATSVLDIGAGTGRALHKLRDELAGARLVGVEPVAELRSIGHKRGIPEDMLVDGDATRLPFADNEFDFVIETGALHHIANPAKAVAEMMRVARVGVMISDSNKLGQGSPLSRHLKSVVYRLGLWNFVIKIQTRGKMYKYSDGDGIFYSYSVYDNIDQIRNKFPRMFIMNTGAMTGTNPKNGSSNVMVIAIGA
jgi:ubiquinone/menaquinone biosynthesis C-methylase UbiE